MSDNNIEYNYNELTPFKWFVLENFPFIEADFDALTNWQLFCKLGKEMNKIIDSTNLTGEQVENLTNAFNELKNYVDNYFENLDVQEEINQKLDELVENGTLTRLIGNYIDPLIEEQNNEISNFKTDVNSQLLTMNNKINAVESGSPLVASSVSEMTDTSRVYVNTSNGYWYYYDGEAWLQGGVYQATQLQENSIGLNNLNQELKNNLNQRINKKDEFNYYKNYKIENINFINKQINETTGNEQNSNNYLTSTNFFYLPKNAFPVIHIPSDFYSQLYYYDENFNYLGYKQYNVNLLINPNASYFKISVFKRPNSAISPNDIIGTYINFEYFDNNNLLNFEIEGNLIDMNKLQEGYLGEKAQLLPGSYKTTQPILLKKNISYTVSTARKLILLDLSFNVIQGSYHSSTVNNYEITPSEDCYIMASKENELLNTFIICKTEDFENTSYNSYKKVIAKDVFLPLNQLIDNQNLINTLDNLKNSNILYGKKYCACGDSYTHGDFSNSTTNNFIFTEGKYAGEFKVYPFFIGNRNQMNVINEAINGSTITYIEGTNNCFSEENGRYTQIPLDSDYITLKFGINDANKNVPLGSINDNTNTTFYGAWNVVLNYLIQNYPKAKIGIIITNDILSKQQYCEAEINIAKKFGLAYLDECFDEKIPLLLNSNKPNVSSSVQNLRNTQWRVNSNTETINTHPNEIAHEYESTIVENFLRSL